MFSSIVVPVDMSMEGAQQKALDVACELARNFGAELHLVSVGGVLPTHGTHYSEKELANKLADYARDLSAAKGIKALPHEIHSADPEAEMDRVLMKAVTDTNADLVVMASHAPGLMDYVFSTHAGHMAIHSKASVFVVR